MAQIDAVAVKEKILNLLKAKGPSLPIHISKETGLQTIFSGAFLSELAGDKTVKISNMKVGGSPLYYLPGQEEKLENFSQHLHGKEKEAFNLIKEKGILSDSDQHPAIRVALRAIKDFAIPFKSDNRIYWKYLTFSQDKIKELLEGKEKIEKEERKTTEKVIEDIKKEKIEITSPESRFEKIHPELAIKEKTLDIFEKEKAEKPVKIKTEPEQFLKEVQAFLTNKNFSIVKVEYSDKKEVVAKIIAPEECLVFAFNKKKITEKELIKAYKKALTFKLPYMILIKDEVSKKMRDMIEAAKNLIKIDKIN